MSYRLEFTLPGLPKTPNQLLGAPWQVRAGEAKKWKQAVFRAVWPYKPSEPLAKAKVVLTRISSREGDFDGIAGSFKSVLDGLVQGKIILDDKPSCIGQPTYHWEKGKAGAGFVRILVEG